MIHLYMLNGKHTFLNVPVPSTMKSQDMSSGSQHNGELKISRTPIIKQERNEKITLKMKKKHLRKYLSHRYK